MKLFKEQNRLDTRKHFFSQRNANDWNKLPQNVIDARTVLQFKIAEKSILMNKLGLI